MEPPNKNKRIKFDRNDPRFKIKPHQQVASSCTGALITSFFMTPLDVVKTRLQVQQKALGSNKCFLYCNGLMDHLCPCGPNGNGTIPQKPPLHFNGTIDAFVKISQTEGIRSLWSGLSPTLVLAIPATVIYFVSYEQISAKYKSAHLKYIVPNWNLSPFFIPLLAGCSARLLAVTIVSPLELIRTKMQSQRLSYLELHRALKSMIGIEGIQGLWRGLTPTLLRDVPFSGIYWTSYENIKKIFHVTSPSFGFSFLAGAFSGSLAAVFTNAFDVVKTHKQIEFGEKVIYTDQPVKNLSSEPTMVTLRKIYYTQGVKGFFTGLTPRLAKVAPACAIMIATFEYGKSFFFLLNVQRHEKDNNY